MLRKNQKALQALIRKLNFHPHPGQAKILEAFCNERFICVLAGRRYGKTKIASIPACYALMEADCKILCVSKTYKLAKKLWRYLLVDVIKLFGTDISILKGEMRMETAWGSTLELGSADNPDSLLGDGFDLVIVDEAATLPEQIWEMYISPCIRDRRGTVIMISTPRGRNWVWKKFELGQQHEGGWWSHKGPSNENYHVWTEDEWELVKRQSDPIYFQQEYMANCVVFEGQVFPDFDDNKHILKDFKLDETWDVYLTIDPGYAQYCAMVWVAHNRVTDDMVIYKEHILAHQGTPQVLAKLIENEPSQGYTAIISDVAGNQRRDIGRDAGHSFVSKLNESTWMMDRGYAVSTRRYRIVTGIQLMRARILNELGEVSLFVTEDCPKVIEMFRNLVFERGKEVYVKDGILDHPADAIRYLIEYLQRSSGRNTMERL